MNKPKFKVYDKVHTPHGKGEVRSIQTLFKGGAPKGAPISWIYWVRTLDKKGSITEIRCKESELRKAR